MIKEYKHLIKVATFPYGANIFKVCESEILSKNKLNESDEDIDNTKTEDIDIGKTEDIDNTKTENIDNTKTEDTANAKTEDIDNTKTEDIDISKTEDIDNTKTEDIDNTKTEAKDEGIHRDRNIFIQVFRYSKRWRDKKGNWKIRQVVWVFWDSGHVSELN